MKSPRHHHRSFTYPAAFLAAAIIGLAPLRASDTLPTRETDKAKENVVRLQEFEVSEPRTSAITASPTDSNIEVLQPQSVISIDYIANNVAVTADYATIASVAPSVANVETNGPGLSEAKHTTIRGIDDGGYNVTFDGIPFGDYNTFSHEPGLVTSSATSISTVQWHRYG